MNKIKKLSADKLGILLFLGSFIFLGIMLGLCFKQSLWKDESFSLLLIQKSYVNIVGTTIMDVHPPMHYFILKFTISLFQIFNLTPNSTIIIARIISVVPFILLLILAFFKVRRNWGWLSCGVFAICLTSMPQLMYYSVTVRMYSWALFFVTVCFIYAYEVICDSNIKNWMMMALAGVCAAYTHYFAAVSVIIVFLSLLTYFVINNKNEIKNWLISVIFSSLLYSLWLFVFVKHLIKVTNNYWIDPLTLSTVFNYIWFIFSPSTIFNYHIELMGVLLLISYVFVFIYFAKCKLRLRCSENFALMGFFVLLFTIFFGIFVSIIVRPIFFDRYMVPSLGVFWLTFAFLLSKSWDYKKIFVPVLCVVLIVSCISTMTFISFETGFHNNYNNLDSFLSQDSIKNAEIILDISQQKYDLDEFQIIEYILKGYHNTTWKNSYQDLIVALNDNKTVWLFSSEECNVILQNCTRNNLTVKKYATYEGVAENGVFENHPYTIYQISY